ncbi:hypothetical protein BSKO_00650 [Bryopsis sp. KO-2023]|nr:hypothetical protein BSKO_00650 [Bryopsis sp. KO-2023]
MLQFSWLFYIWTLFAKVAPWVVGISSMLATTQWLSHKAARSWYSRQLSSARARWELLHVDHGTTALEYITLGWLNVILRQFWPTFLERRISERVTQSLQNALNRVLQKNCRKWPWKHIASISVKQGTLGMVPPRFDAGAAKCNLAKHKLKVEAGMKWKTSGFQVVLELRSESNILLPKMKTRIMLSDLEISGRVLLGLTLGKEPPGITRIDFSFEDTPLVHMHACPLGVPMTDMPGIPELVTRQITAILTKRFTEPHRHVIDVTRIYSRQRAKNKGGPGGLLVIRVVSVKDLQISSGGKDSLKNESQPLGQMHLYCECLHGVEVLRTPVVSGEGRADWGWEFDVPLFGPIMEGKDILEIKIINSGSMGEPQIIAKGMVDLWEVGLIADTEPVAHLVGVTGGYKGTLTMKFSLHKSPRKEEHILQGVDTNRSRNASSGDAPAGRVVSFTLGNQKPKRELLLPDSSLRKLAEIEKTLGEGMEDSGRTTENETAGSIADSSQQSLFGEPSLSIRRLRTKSLSAVKEVLTDAESSGVSTPRSYGSELKPTEDELSLPPSQAFSTLTQVSKLEEMLVTERNHHMQELKALQAYTVQLESQINAEKYRRYDEELRALIEGGKFILHKVGDDCYRHVWYSPSGNVLRWAPRRLASETQGFSPKNDVVDQGRTISIASIALIKEGTEMFPKQDTSSWGSIKRYVKGKKGGRLGPVPIPENSFSIFFSTKTAIHLEIPMGGNGRSRDEWVSAFSNLGERLLDDRIHDRRSIGSS